MAPDIDSPRSDEGDLSLRWSGRLSLTPRILAVNILALAMLAGGFFYLDSYRTRLVDQRLEQASHDVRAIALGLAGRSDASSDLLLVPYGSLTDARLRVYDAAGVKQSDSWQLTGPTYRLRDPDEEPWQRHVARFLDRAIDRIVGAEPLGDFAEPERDVAGAWAEIRELERGGGTAVRPSSASGVAAESTERCALCGIATTRIRFAPDRTPMISAATPLGDGYLLLTTNARDITRIVREERLRIGIVLGVAIIISVLLSLFLARTIVRPLRRLARAAVRVRLGRAREVVVPRLPSRRDEIGMLARALSDMSQALRIRIDATEAFAADVTHELKNPLASLRSAVDALSAIDEPDAQRRLLAVIQDDVRRLDRLITDIAEASRLDAQLSHATFAPVDLGLLIERLVRQHDARGGEGDVEIAFARPRKGVAVVMGEAGRIARAIENLLDNAISFSPAGGLVQVVATRVGNEVIVRVEDQGPGVPLESREAIFRRFHSIRPDEESFGRHSGLGLAIAKAIVEGHSGTIAVEDRGDAARGASFVIRLPAAGE